MTQRWTLVDTETHDSWTMPINPRSMTAPPIVKNLKFASSTNRRNDLSIAGFRSPTPAQPWEWAGVIRTKEHHDNLAAWAKRDSVIEVHDHMGRVFEVVIQSYIPTDKRSRISWRSTYTMKTLLLRRTA